MHTNRKYGKVPSTNGQTSKAEVSENNVEPTAITPVEPRLPVPIKKKAARYVETGDAINVQHFYELKGAVIGLDDAYLSPNATYSVANMEVVYANGALAIEKVTNRLSLNQEAIDVQTVTFKSLKKDATRAKNIFITCGVPEEAVIRCNHITKLIRGERMGKLKAGEEDENKISASHQSHTQQIQHVDELIALFNLYPEYVAPDDLTVAAFRDRRDAMNTSLQNVKNTNVNLQLARMHRNRILQAPMTGLVDVALGVKKVVVGIFGSRSAEYRMIGGIGFTRNKGYKDL